ncbi:MAG TPA: ABC transporter ATP-binding protein [Actinomycetota bacterium]|nr:ABC transporter ATP-binding protein [Actinomycetota bacterium]
MIEINGVSKWFKDVVALSDVTFQMGPGVTALLGPNGAGKSSLLRIVCGLTAPSRGDVRVLGKRPRHDLSLFSDIGLVPQQEALFERLTSFELVRAAAILQRVPSPEDATVQAINEVDLDPSDKRPLRSFSKGMRQRVKVAQALVHSPKILILDEPLNGLDPRQRLHMIELFRRWGSEGRTVVVSSHVLEEVEKIGSRVVVLGRGRLVAEGDFHEIRRLMDQRPHRIRLLSGAPAKLGAGLIAEGLVVGARVRSDEEIEVETEDVMLLRSQIAKVARKNNIRLKEMSPLDEDLESVFRYLVKS